jgi:hypothetical protein
MFKFILGNIGYFVWMAIGVFCCITVEGPLAGKLGVLGLMSFAAGTPAAKRTRFGLVDKRYKEKSFIWWQILIGLILFALTAFLINKTT